MRKSISQKITEKSAKSHEEKKKKKKEKKKSQKSQMKSQDVISKHQEEKSHVPKKFH